MLVVEQNAGLALEIAERGLRARDRLDRRLGIGRRARGQRRRPPRLPGDLNVALFFTQLLNGIQNGAVYASLAVALVLIFRTTGILNFAQGEMALFSTYIVWKLHRRRGMPVWLAILLAMAISFVGGALIERVVIRPVERASPLVIVIVTIGMFLAINSLTQLAVRERRAGVAERRTRSTTWRPGGVLISSDTLALVGVLVVECVLLYFLLQHTKLGLAFRGVASNPESSRLLGVPVGRILMVGLGPGRGGRRARRRARRADHDRARAVVDAADPRVRVRGRRVGRLRQRARRGRRRA